MPLDRVAVGWPALRERPDDILPLAEYFIELHAPQQGYRLGENARKQLLTYGWPGNVRELDNVIQRSLIMARGLHIQAVDLMLPSYHYESTMRCRKCFPPRKSW